MKAPARLGVALGVLALTLVMVLAPARGVDAATYIVQPGDTMFSIARAHGTTVDALARANSIADPSRIFAGQVLVIPHHEPIHRTYVVRPGDTLFRIAHTFGTTVDALIRANRILDPNLIFPGKVLFIPDHKKLPPAPAPPPSPDMSVCLRGHFVEDGLIAAVDRPARDAAGIGDFRFARHPGCERMVIDLVTAEGTAAHATGAIRAEFLLGVIRIHLGHEFDLEAFIGGPTEAHFGGDLVHSAYVVRSLDGSFYIDVHLASAALANVFILDGPARIVVDVQPGGAMLRGPAPTADNVVVLTPRHSETHSYPLAIRGYARTFEANVLALIRSNAQIDVEDFTTAASWLEAWGEFELVIPSGPLGPIELFVGERSAKDGTEQGVRIHLTMR